ncbi:heme peroxidase [Setomelanomma holmii]|uniref:Peroxidase n=1 Tax=Setomelanomma holmii TaxID=210430 RepID=A0A9P4GXS2_9PLEO|nr:heme peroxidase [Setomelanomma holmii]
MRKSLIISFALLAPSSQTYIWPSQHDQLDDLLYLQFGYIKDGTLSDQVATCDFGAKQPGIQKAAEWVRTAFHDSVTYDAATKTGGLDASVQYELDRPENLGAALNNTLADISSSVNIRSSAADLLALSLVMSVARCGKMRVPLRLGRKDATEAGIKGVPEAHTDLATTRKRFETASLHEADMITLIACGHSIGGVHSIDHPEIVPGAVSAEKKLSFDLTKGVLDNAVVLEYLDNSTSNPLIRNTNDTLNSDKRIFAADDNATMKKLVDPAYFKSQCEAVFERMLSLVPVEVTLTEPLEPADIRPYITTYQLASNGSVQFSGRLRVRVTPVTGRDQNNLTASIILPSRNGSQATEIPARRATYKGGMSSGYLDEAFSWFEFSQILNASEAFSSFNIRVNDITYDNGGTGGYPINRDVLYQEAQSCVSFDAAANQDTLGVTAAISKSLLGGGIAPQIRVVQRTKVQGNFIPRLKQVVVQMVRSSEETADYVYYTASTTIGADSLSTTFDLEVGESNVEFINTGSISVRCTSLKDVKRT